MSISFSVLGSGSAGNCTLVQFHDEKSPPRNVLIDAGLSPRQTNLRLARFGLSALDIDDIFVTHFDSDHFHTGWFAKIRGRPVRVHAHRRHRARPLRRGLPTACLCPFDNEVEYDGVAGSITPVPFNHDQLGTFGFVIEHAGVRLGFATDLGRPARSLYDAFYDLDALALESNYDPQMQRDSPRPDFLKRRIMNGAGHLSNEQSLDAVRKIAAQSALQHVALLHLSRQCNCPKLLMNMYRVAAPELAKRVTITDQRTPTTMLRVTPRAAAVTVAKPQATLFS